MQMMSHTGLVFTVWLLVFLLRKLTFLSKLLSNYKDTMSSRIFISLAIEDIYNISVVQPCKMLGATLAANIVDQCLSNPNNAPEIV